MSLLEKFDARLIVRLGSPLGFPLGYMLMEHKAELGNMYVSKVRVFYNETPARQPCYLFYVEQPGSSSQVADTFDTLHNTVPGVDESVAQLFPEANLGIRKFLRVRLLASKL
jgi:hypothetical protein